jgi:hypothetical protein
MVVIRVVYVFPDEIFNQLHKNKRKEKQDHPFVVHHMNLVFRIGVVVDYKGQNKSAEYKGV